MIRLTFAEVTDKRPNYDRAQAAVKDVCRNCHTAPLIDRVYREAEAVVASTNEKVTSVRNVINALRTDGTLSGAPFTHPVDFDYFDLWHYYGRTSKHGAFMGGADFVQWHGNYPILKHSVETRHLAEELRRGMGAATASAPEPAARARW